MLISSYFNPYREKNIARFVVKIHSTSDISKKIGYVVCDTDIKVLQKMMKKYILNDEAYIWLQPMGDNMILSLGDIDKLGVEAKNDFLRLSDNISNGNEKEASELEHSSNVLFKSPQAKYNMDVYCLMPQEILRHNQTLLTQNLIYIGLVLVVVLILLIWYLTHTLTKPLEQLTDTVTRIGAGETSLRATYTLEDEIGTLGREFNHMLDEIENYIGREYETRLLLNQAEYKALQSQINPHFLYNTLDTMSSIASIQNCELVSNLCQSLSNIFRYSLDIKHPYATLANEINHLKNYIFVMNVRMREEVKYSFQIDDTLLTDSIPRISLQPLVENALNHGLKNKHGEKWIQIRVSTEDNNQILVSVADNGVGMDAAQMNALLEKNERDRVESGNSIGIYNINARLKMLYGDDYGIHVESKLGEGTTVQIRIPRKKIEQL